jgi:hypothetical protein
MYALLLFLTLPAQYCQRRTLILSKLSQIRTYLYAQPRGTTGETEYSLAMVNIERRTFWAASIRLHLHFVAHNE